MLYTFACPPYGWSAAAWLVPGLLLAPTRRLPPLRGALCGVIFGMVFGGGMSSWALDASLEYFALNRLVAGAFVLGVWFLNGGLPFGILVATYGVAVRRLGAGARAPLGAWLWVGSEVLRTTLFTGMPWELLGHTQFRNLGLVQVADLGGVYAISFVIALASIAGAEGAGEAWGQRTRVRRILLRRLALPAALLAATLAYGVHSRSLYAAPASGDTRSVAIVQGNVPNAFRWKRAFFERQLGTYAELTREIGGAAPDLIVWPENAVNFYLEQEPMLHAHLRGVAAQAREGLVLGGPRLAGSGRAHNSAYLLGPDGTVRGTYDKRRLVPFAEYNPLRTLTRGAAADEVDTYVPGTSARLLETASLRLGTVICYEAVFPHLVRDLVGRGAELLVNLSNDTWMDGEDGAASAQHFSMAIFRAIENRRYLVRASSSGVSGFVSPYGDTYGMVPRQTADAAVARVVPLRGVTPYGRLGDSWVAVAGVMALATLAGARRRHAS
jgi:apolipoprotein N-acyltransferase